MNYHLSISNISIEINISRKRNLNHVTIFNYHQVDREFNSILHSPYTFTSLDFFEEQIIWINKNYKIIPLNQAIEMIDTNRIDNKYACITFDDGDKSILKSMQVLEKYNIPATFFINGSHIDNQGAYWFPIYNFIKNNPKYKYLLTDKIEQNISLLRRTENKKLYNRYSQIIEDNFDIIKDDFNIFVSKQDLENINSHLFDIGIHGFEHQRFSMKSLEWQKENLIKDIKILSNYPSYKAIFAIPFGRTFDWNIDTIKVCFDLDLKFVYADGGINIKNEIGYKRIPADSQNLKELIKNQMVKL